MRKLLTLLAAFAMILTCAVPASAADDEDSLLIVICEELGFSTVCDAKYTYDYSPDAGLSIYESDPDSEPRLQISNAETTDFDVETYFTGAYTRLLESTYGSRLIYVTDYQAYDISGYEFYGLIAYYIGSDSEEHVRTCLINLTSDGFVRYEGFYDDSQIDEMSSMIGTAAFYYQPDPHFYDELIASSEPTDAPAPDSESESADVPDPAPDSEPVPEDDPESVPENEPVPEPDSEPVPVLENGIDALPEAGQSSADGQIISCPEMEFSLLTDPSFTWDFDEQTGLTIYMEHEGYIPYIMVFRSEDWIVETAEYIREQYTPHMREEYGSDLIDVVEYDSYTLGGRPVDAALYTYFVGETPVEMLRAYDVQDSHTVVYTAKYIQGEGEPVMAALGQAVSTYQPDASYYENAPSQTAGPAEITFQYDTDDSVPPSDGTESAPEPGTESEPGTAPGTESEPGTDPEAEGGPMTDPEPEALETDILLYTYYHQMGWGDLIEAGFIDRKGGVWFLSGSAAELNWPSGTEAQLAYLEDNPALEHVADLTHDEVFQLESLIGACEDQGGARASGANDAGCEYSYAVSKNRDGGYDLILLGASGDDFMENTDPDAQSLYKTLRTALPQVTTYAYGTEGMGPTGFTPVPFAEFMGFDMEELRYADIKAVYEDCEAGPSETALSADDKLKIRQLLKKGLVTGKTGNVSTTGGTTTYYFVDKEGNTLAQFTLYEGDLYTGDGTYSLES